MTDKTELEVTQRAREAAAKFSPTLAHAANVMLGNLDNEIVVQAFTRFERDILATRTPDPTPVAWMPIESAPKDGTRILAVASRRGWEKNGETIVVCAWHGMRWAIMGANPDPTYPDTKDECTPRLWQSIPDHIEDTRAMVPPAVPADGLVEMVARAIGTHIMPGSPWEANLRAELAAHRGEA